MKPLRSFVFLLSFVSLFLATSVSAATVPQQTYTYALPSSGHVIWVATTGSDMTGDGSTAKPYATPGGASRKAFPGDTIVVKAGTYAEFGAIRRGGTAKSALTIQPEPGTRPIFALRDAWTGAEIAASYLKIYGFEIHQQQSVAKGACVRFTRVVEDVSFFDLNIHDCGTGIQLSQPGASADHVVIQDVTLAHLDTYGVRCSFGSCRDVEMMRLKVDGVSSVAGSAAISFDATSSAIFVEDSEIGLASGDAIVLSGEEGAVSNSSIHDTGRRPLVLGRGGSIFNNDIRSAGQGIVIRGGGTYRVRGNLMVGLSSNGRGYPFQVAYDAGVADQGTALILDANRIASSDGNIGLPAVTSLPAPVLTTLRSNSFFFKQASDGVELPMGRFVTSTNFVSTTGTGLMRLGGDTSVVGEPQADDLISPIYAGGQAGKEPMTGGTWVFAGTRLQASGPAIYLYGQDGERHAFPNEAVYRSWFHDFSGVTRVSDEAMARIPLGKNVTYRPGVRLVKIMTDPKVYAVGSGEELRWIKMEDVAKALYGEDWMHRVDDIPDTFFMNYVVGDEIAKAEDFHPSLERVEISSPAELF